MLQHYQVPLSGLVAEQLLQLAGKSVKKVLSLDRSGFRGEQSEPLEAGDDAISFFLTRKFSD